MFYVVVVRGVWSLLHPRALKKIIKCPVLIKVEGILTNPFNIQRPFAINFIHFSISLDVFEPGGVS